MVLPGYVRSGMTEARHNASKFGLPFFMEGDKAAKIIAEGVADDVPFVAFPFPMHLLAFVLRTFPYYMADSLFWALEKGSAMTGK